MSFLYPRISKEDYKCKLLKSGGFQQLLNPCHADGVLSVCLCYLFISHVIWN